VAPVGSGSGALSAAFAGGALWFLSLGAPTSRGTAEAALQTARDLGADRPAVGDRIPLGEARVEAGTALATWHDQIVGVFGGPGRITVFRYDPATGAQKSLPIAAPEDAPNVSVAVVGDRALAAWDDSQSGVEYAWVDLASMAPSAKMRLDGNFAEPAVAASFGGVIALTDSTADPSGLRLLAPGAAEAAPMPATGNDNGGGATAAGTASRVFLLYNVVAAHPPGDMLIAAATMKLATLTDAHGAGVVIDVGAAGAVPEGAVAASGWGGAVAAYANDKSGVDVVAATPDGALIGRPLTVTGDGEPARSPAIAADGKRVYVLWNQPEAMQLRLARVACE
jgi:hypothetical protein